MHHGYSCWQAKVAKLEENPDAYDEESEEESQESDNSSDDPEINTAEIVGKEIPTSSKPVGKDIPTDSSSSDKGVGKDISPASSVPDNGVKVSSGVSEKLPATSVSNSPQSSTSESNGSTPASGASSGRADKDVAFLGFIEGLFLYICHLIRDLHPFQNMLFQSGKRAPKEFDIYDLQQSPQFICSISPSFPGRPCG